jgi:hypothetical protein
MTTQNPGSPAPSGRGGPILVVLGLLAAVGVRGWTASQLRWRNLEDGSVLEVAHNVRAGKGLVTYLSTAAHPAASLPAPSLEPPVWPWLLGHLGRVNDILEMAQWVPLGIYALTIALAWVAGRAFHPAAVLPTLSSRVHGGHAAALLVAFEREFIRATTQAASEGISFLLLVCFFARHARPRTGILAGLETGAWLALLVLAAPPMVVLAPGVGLWAIVALGRGPKRVVGALRLAGIAVGAAGAWTLWSTFVAPPPIAWAFDLDAAKEVPHAGSAILALAAAALAWAVLGAFHRGGLLAACAALALGGQVAVGAGQIVDDAVMARPFARLPDRHASLVAWLKLNAGGKKGGAVLLDEETARRIGWRLRGVKLHTFDRDTDYERVRMLAAAHEAAWILHPGDASRWRFRQRSAGRIERDYELLRDAPSGYSVLKVRPEPVAQTASPRRVLLIGVDGASWTVMGPMVEAGELPTFARLYREGASMVEFETMESQDSPVVWTSVATGRRPRDHGVKDYTEEVEGVGKVPITSNSRKVPAIWNVASAAGRSVEVVNWWASWPSEPVNGVIVSDHANPAAAGWMAGKYFDADTEALKARLQDTFPGELAATLDPYWIAPEAFPLEDFVAQSGITPAQVEQLVAAPYNQRTAYSWLKTFYTLDQPHHRIAVDHLRTQPADLTMVYLRGPDPVQHYGWNLVEPWRYATPPAELAWDRGLVEATYRYSDVFVGALIEAAGPDTTVIVMSDHGAEPCSYAVGKNSKKRPGCHRDTATGILFITGPGVKAGQRIQNASPMDIAPTMAWLAGLPVSREMPGRVIGEALEWGAAAATPLNLVDSWGARTQSAEPSTASPADDQMLEQLRGLGYIE